MRSSAARAWSHLERWAPALALVLALALRWREAARFTLWYDELYTLASVQRPLADVVRVARADVHPPLHFVLDWAWAHVAHGDLALRALSIAFALASLALAWAMGRALFDRATATLAVLLLALHPWHLEISQEARSYPLLWMLLALAQFSAWRWFEHGRRGDAARFVVAAAAALWTHYLAGPALALPFAWGAWRLRGERARLATWVALHAAVAVAFAPQVPVLLEQMHRQVANLPGHATRMHDTVEAVRRLAFSNLHAAPPMLLLALAAFRAPRTRRAAAWAAVLGPGTLLLCWLAGLAGLRLFGAKYMMLTLPPLMLLVSAGALRTGGRAGAIVLAAMLVAFGVHGLVSGEIAHPEEQAFTHVRDAIHGEVRAGDVVFAADTHAWLFARRYLPQSRARLALMGQELPYFEGAAVVPDSCRAGAAEFSAPRAPGTQAWALAARPLGTDTRAAAAAFGALGGAPALEYDVVRVWRLGGFAGR